MVQTVLNISKILWIETPPPPPQAIDWARLGLSANVLHWLERNINILLSKRVSVNLAG